MKQLLGVLRKHRLPITLGLIILCLLALSAFQLFLVRAQPQSSNGSGIFALGLCLAAVPLLLLAGCLLLRGLRRVKRHFPLAVTVAGIVLLLALAACLPLLLGLLPDWALPGKWSDFSHWGLMVQQFSAFIDSLFRTAAQQDVPLKQALVSVLVLSAANSMLVFWFATATHHPRPK